MHSVVFIQNDFNIFRHKQVKRIELSRKVIYYFAVYAIVKEINVSRASAGPTTPDEQIA